MNTFKQPHGERVINDFRYQLSTVFCYLIWKSLSLSLTECRSVFWPGLSERVQRWLPSRASFSHSSFSALPSLISNLSFSFSFFRLGWLPWLRFSIYADSGTWTLYLIRRNSLNALWPLRCGARHFSVGTETFCETGKNNTWQQQQQLTTNNSK